MKAMLDINVFMDFLYKRGFEYPDVVGVFDMACGKKIQACFPAHGATTLYYLIKKSSGNAQANEIITWLLKTFEISQCDIDVLKLANSLDFSDFEDATLCATAIQASCECIVTSNVRDFTHSPLAALTHKQFCQKMDGRQSEFTKH